MVISVFKVGEKGEQRILKQIRLSMDTVHYFHLIGDEFSFEEDAEDDTVKSLIKWLEMEVKVRSRNIESRRKWELNCINAVKDKAMPVLKKLGKDNFVQIY